MTKTRKIITVLLIICLLGFAVIYYGMYFFGLSGMHSNLAVSDRQLKVACIGDSTTYGHGIKNWKNNNYPVMLEKELGDKYCVANFGMNGSCAQSFSDQPYEESDIFKDSIEFDADIIIFMLGTNDSKDINFRSAGDFKKEYSELINKYIKSENAPEIYLCTPTSAFYVNGKTEGNAEFDISIDNLQKITQAVTELAEERNFGLININSFTAEHPEWFEKDGIHPDNIGAEEIAKEIASVIKKLFSTRRL